MFGICAILFCFSVLEARELHFYMHENFHTFLFFTNWMLMHCHGTEKLALRYLLNHNCDPKIVRLKKFRHISWRNYIGVSSSLFIKRRWSDDRLYPGDGFVEPPLLTGALYPLLVLSASSLGVVSSRLDVASVVASSSDPNRQMMSRPRLTKPNWIL